VPTQEQFIEALWGSYTTARFKGLEWKWIEWVRDPLVRRLSLTKPEFNRLLEEAIEASMKGTTNWVILTGEDVTARRQGMVKRHVPVVVQGKRMYMLSMRPRLPDVPYVPALKPFENPDRDGAVADRVPAQVEDKPKT
jgi:hypothetical protein